MTTTVKIMIPCSFPCSDIKEVKMKAYLPGVISDAEKVLFEKREADPLDLMKKAAAEVYKNISDLLRRFDAITVLCGKGNNAGDGYELARLLKRDGFNVCCIAALGVMPATDIAKDRYDAFVEAGGKVEYDENAAKDIIAMSDVIFDAVFGIGFKGSIEKGSALYELIDTANRSRGKRIAIDVPSGINPSDGSVGGAAFLADTTVTITAVKAGMLSYPAKLFCGNIETADIGISSELLDSYENPCVVPDDRYVKRVLRKRSAVSNKGDYGKLLCVCGSEYMKGAAVLSTGAALRAGTGLVTLASEESVIRCAQSHLLEPIYIPLNLEDERETDTFLQSVSKYSSILIGCGLGQSEKKRKALEYIIKNVDAQLIIDADGINMLADNINVLKEAKKAPIITPHPGEFSRISGLDVGYINDNRISCAVGFSKGYGCITVLKGAGTITASPDGRFAVNTSGNAGLAKGGSGDVLAGLIAGLCACSGASPYECAAVGVYLHGRAADILREKYSEYGLLPSDLSEEFAKLLP